MSPLVKNVGLAFLAGFVSSLGAFAAKSGDVPPTRAVLFAAGAAAVWAGARAAVGYLKARYGEPFAVDTEA